MKNREGQTIELSELTKVDESEHGFAVTMENSWTLFFGKDEAGDFTPRVGDWILLSYEGFNTIAGIIIEGRVIRAKTSAQCQADHEQWMKNSRLEKLERYIEQGEELKARVEKLPKPLRERMYRFAEKDGVDFWIETAPYEMHALEGAAALITKVMELGFIDNIHFGYEAGDVEGAVEWINDWWAINSDKHDPPYDYAKQMEIVPHFGKGHSGWTASAAKGLAVAILEGKEV